MSDPQPPLTETPARREALQDVLFKLIRYNPLLGVYLKGGAPVSGPKRRTLAELRQYGYIKPGSTTQTAVMILTPEGDALAIEWGLKSSSAEAPAEAPAAEEAATE
jgi:hypothetical protein